MPRFRGGTERRVGTRRGKRRGEEGRERETNVMKR
jgi:hypothetical protein